MTRKESRMIVGKAMNLKIRVANNLFVFSSPDVAWVAQNLSKLDNDMNDELDIINRHKGLQHSLDAVKENLDLSNGILQHRLSSILEWIIIVLILFEVLHLIIENSL
jgi:required for meiotic nuclear division protein 1